MRSPGYLLAVIIFTVILQTSWTVTFSDEGTDCGRVVSADANGTDYGNYTGDVRFPWHAVIYKYKYCHCSGTIITRFHVLSLASCFKFYKWFSVKSVESVAEYTVMGGKRYKRWDDERDVNTQKKEVADIKIPPGTRYELEWQSNLNIVVLILTTPFVFNYYVKPICLSFDSELDRKRVGPGNVGAAVVWSPSDEPPRMIEITHISVNPCEAKSDSADEEFITRLTICGNSPPDAEVSNENNLNSGQSFVVPETVAGVRRYYLRGLKNKQGLNFPRGSQFFTHFMPYRIFINDSLAVPHRPGTTYVPVGNNFINMGAFICQALKVPQCTEVYGERTYG